MIKHTVSEPKKAFLPTLLLVVGLVVAINFSVHLINRLPGGYGGPTGLFLIMFLAGYTSRLMNRKLAAYTYEWDGKQLKVLKKLGRREKTMLELPRENIEWFRPIEEVRPQLGKMKRPRKTLAMSCRVTGDKVYLLQYKDGSKIYRLILEPSEKLRKELKKAAKENGQGAA